MFSQDSESPKADSAVAFDKIMRFRPLVPPFPATVTRNTSNVVWGEDDHEQSTFSPMMIVFFVIAAALLFAVLTTLVLYLYHWYVFCILCC